MDAGAELVDFVQHHDTVARSDFANGLDDVARQRADIGAPVATNFRLVVHAAEAHPHKLAVHRARDRLAERGLADAGRPDETQNGRLAVWREFAHGEVFDDAPFYFFQAIMVVVENASRLGDVDRLSSGRLQGRSINQSR